MEALLKLSDGIDALVSRIGKWAALLAVPLMLTIMYDVIQRKFGGQGSIKLQELEWHLHTGLFMLCFGFAYIRDAHVRIELIRDNLRPRTRAIIEMIGAIICILPFCALVLYFGFDFVLRSYETHEVSAATTGLTHRWIIKSTIPVGFGLLAMAGLSVFLKCYVFVFGPSNLRNRAGYYVGTHHADLGDAAAKLED
ncbi:C4-dicarboxylate ABC transporter permease [Thalassospira lucentensis]|jgi:TRAP-type mannitol/chloroaromatic compound transport system permease small subunit|uniref:TRAP transporter small permease protein n=2 Tax=Thalassospira TaxID=168934 RepID=A0A154L137_9PROT|nr:MULTISPECIES: TRAP transporter small permease subunit [Thalassospira]KZB57474.1 C4-dicarboxylate ABC transporter permease [Thalassospira xiamenensis]KZB61021.1 C4-dicarboxylate ABC transporter permease [Thalassospira lucentensis]MAZ31770.1 C4-dicarboxylate ABC transporter permease [Thalassospira sp.]MBO9505985.1 TRAP transporter small permease subunit [Thalassospira sp. A3_1]MCH2276199.1 TRAP transporter small permease subunit [Thalassospira sp.]